MVGVFSRTGLEINTVHFAVLDVSGVGAGLCPGRAAPARRLRATSGDRRRPDLFLANLSHWPKERVDALRLLLENVPLVPVEQVLEIQKAWPHGHVAAVPGALRKLGLERKLRSRRSRHRDLVVGTSSSP